MNDERVLRRLMAAGRALVEPLDVEGIFDVLLDTACELTGARYGAVGVVAADGHGLRRFVTRGLEPAECDAIGDPPRGRGVLGILIEDPRPLRLDELGAHPRSYGFPAAHPPMHTFLGVPIVCRGEAYGHLYLTEKTTGGRFTDDDEEIAIALCGWASVGLDNARTYERAEHRRTALEVAVQRLEATTAIAHAVGSETDLQRVLELIVKRARALVDARAMILLLAEGDELVVAAGAGEAENRALGGRLARVGSAMGAALAAGRSERVDDARSRPALGDEEIGVLGARTAVLVPLVYRGDGIGVLAAFDRLDGGDTVFGADEQALLEAFAASAATAVATAQSAERGQLRRAVDAAERERRRWARELHEGTLQGLGALRVLLATGLRRGDAAGLEVAACEAVDAVGEEIARLRRLISELRPAALDELGLGPAIESVVDHAGALHGIEARLTVDLGAERLSPDLETTVYRIVQEALANAVRHARAHRLHVHIRRGEGDVELEVSDDGRGFDPGAPGAGFGLASMRERAGLHGGTFSVASSAAGTTVSATFPLQWSTRPLSSA